MLPTAEEWNEYMKAVEERALSTDQVKKIENEINQIAELANKELKKQLTQKSDERDFTKYQNLLCEIEKFAKEFSQKNPDYVIVDLRSLGHLHYAVETAAHQMYTDHKIVGE